MCQYLDSDWRNLSVTNCSWIQKISGKKSWIIWSWSFSRDQFHALNTASGTSGSYEMSSLDKLYSCATLLSYFVLQPPSVDMWNLVQFGTRINGQCHCKSRVLGALFSQTLLKKVVVRWTKKYFCTFNLEIITFCCTYISVTGLAADLYLAGTY